MCQSEKIMLKCLILAYISMGARAGPVTTVEVPEENEVGIDFPYVSRAQWNARQPRTKEFLNLPVPYVVIHHSYTPGACYSSTECKAAMRSMQNFHMDDRKWWDIGYNFAVGSDGVVYEGRGWKILGAHSLHFNAVSLGIVLIGDWRERVPPANQIKAAQALIAAGVGLGYIKSDYKVVGHRQVRSTECPGGALYNNLQTWDHYSPHPSGPSELLEVEDLPDKIKNLLKMKATTL